MGIPAAAALCITGTLLVLATASQDRHLQDGHLQVGLFPPCSATLSPEGPCERGGDGCPFVFNLPPMTVQFPKQLMDLERLVVELQMLKDNVDELRRMCKDCAVGHEEKECARGAEEAHRVDIDTQEWENNKGIKDENRREALAEEKMEQVENVRIMERKKLDRKQTERDGAVKGAADKQDSPRPKQHSTYGKSDPRVRQTVDRKKQTEAADEREDGGLTPGAVSGEIGRQELHDKAVLDEEDILDKSSDAESEKHMVNNKDESTGSSRGDSRDRDIWQDKHHKAGHEERQEKTFGDIEKITKQPIARDRPVWRDKTRVDLNQMETDRGSEERGEKNSDARSRGKNALNSSQTMKSSSAERIKLSVKNGTAVDYFGRDHSEKSQSNRDAADSERDIKDETTTGERFRQVENINLMEGTDERSGVVNSAQSHGFIDLDQGKTLTSPPSFTTSHLTTAVKKGQERQMNGNSGIKKQLGDDVRLARGHEKGAGGGETKVGQTERPDLEYRERNGDLGKRYESTNTQVDASSTFEPSTDLGQENQNIIEPPTQSIERTHLNATFPKGAKQPSSKIDSINNTNSIGVSQGERDAVQRSPSKTSHVKDTYAEVSNLDKPSSTTGKKSSKTTGSMNYESDQINISEALSTNDGLDGNISPVPTNSHVPSEAKHREHGLPSQNNTAVKGSNATHANVHGLTKISSAETEPEFVLVTSHPTSFRTDSRSRFTQDFEQELIEASNEPTFPEYNRMDSKKEYLHPKVQSHRPTTSTAEALEPKETTLRDKKERFNVPQNNHDEQPSNPKTAAPLTAGTRKGNATRSRTIEEASQGHPDEEYHGTDRPGKHVQSAKDEMISTHNIVKGQSKHTEREYLVSTALVQTSSTHAMDEDATTLNPTVSSHVSRQFDKEYRPIAKKAPTKSDEYGKDLDREHFHFDASNKFTIPPTGREYTEDSTISTPTTSHYNRALNNGDEKTQREPHYGQPPTDFNEKVNDFQIIRVINQPTNGFVEGTTSSPPALRQDASFKNDITPTTFTSHQLSPTTTSPSPTGNKRISNSRTIPNQKPKPSIRVKPGADPREKNDHKLDRSPPPDSQAKNDQKQKHPKVTPGKAPRPLQIPQKPHQSTPKADRRHDNVVKPTPPTPTSTPAPSVTGLHVEKTPRPSVHGDSQVMHEEIQRFDKASGGLRKKDSSKLKHFIQKAGNSTRNITLSHHRLPEFNGTTQRTDGGIKKSPKVNLKVPQKDQKPKLQAPKVKVTNPKLTTSKKVKQEQAPKVKIPKGNKGADLKNGTKVFPGPKQPNKPVKPKAIPATKIKPPLKAKESLPKSEVTPPAGPVKLTTALYPLRQNVTDVLTMNSNSTVLSDMGSQTTNPTPPLTAKLNHVLSTLAPTKRELNQRKSPLSQAPRVQLRPTAHPAFTAFRSTAAPAPYRGPKVPAVESTTPSARELRVKINQVAAFLNKSSPQRPPGRPLDAGPTEPHKDGEKIKEQKPDIQAVRDCSDHMLRGHTRSGLYLVTPDPSGGTVPVLCDMAVDGGGWTVLQRRLDGSVSFNRSWAEYRDGFGQLEGEFWLGNHLLHLLTRDRNMELRVKLEDFQGVREHAHYHLFKVASERMRFRLSVDGYSGTAGDALRFSTQYDHNNRAFTTPDRDNDRYPSGNCGAYYSSGWWFDACMAANLNGRYYKGSYKGVRDGIYWGTWRNISTEYYPTNERLAFKTVTMMMRPRGFEP